MRPHMTDSEIVNERNVNTLGRFRDPACFPYKCASEASLCPMTQPAFEPRCEQGDRTVLSVEWLGIAQRFAAHCCARSYSSDGSTIFAGGCGGALRAFVYATAEQLGFPYSVHTRQLVSGGYAITFPGNVTYNEYASTMAQVLDNSKYAGPGWLDRQTRRVNIDMTVYNVRDHMLAVLQLDVEFSTSGTIQSSIACDSVSLATGGIARIVLEVLITFYLLWSLIVVVRRTAWTQSAQGDGSSWS